MWERGLKLQHYLHCAFLLPSLPMWERGLKHVNYNVLGEITSRSPCGSVD